MTTDPELPVEEVVLFLDELCLKRVPLYVYADTSVGERGHCSEISTCIANIKLNKISVVYCNVIKYIICAKRSRGVYYNRQSDLDICVLFMQYVYTSIHRCNVKQQNIREQNRSEPNICVYLRFIITGHIKCLYLLISPRYLYWVWVRRRRTGSGLAE